MRKNLIPVWSVHSGVFFILSICVLTRHAKGSSLTELLHAASSINLFLLFSLWGLWHLLCARSKNRAETVVWTDYALFVFIVLFFLGTSQLPTYVDLGAAFLVVTVYYWLHSKHQPGWNRISLLLAAITINLLFAPLFFQYFKDWILQSETLFAAKALQLIGLDVYGNGHLLGYKKGEGMRLLLIGACSIFSNLSNAFMALATVKILVKSPFAKTDVLIFFILALMLVLANTTRFGLMLKSWSSYEYWHHGNGVVILSLLQFALIVSVCLAYTRKSQRWF